MTSSTSLRIAMLAIHSSPLGQIGTQHTGGMSTYLLELAGELGKDGHQIDIFTRVTTADQQQIISLQSNVRIVHLDVKGTKKIHPTALYEYSHDFVLTIRAFAKKNRTSYQLIHSHYWISGVIGQSLKSIWHCPHLITFHTFAATKISSGHKHQESRKRLTQEAFLIENCDAVIVSTAAEEKLLHSKINCHPKKAHIIPCGVNCNHFKPEKLPPHKENSPFMVLFVGRFDPMKGIDLLLTSFSQLPANPVVHLTLIGGDGPETTTHKQISKNIRRLGINNLVKLTGPILHSMLPKYYQTTDIVAVSSHYESFGLVILEALASGTPVISTPVGIAPQIIKPGINGYIADTDDTKNYAQTISKTLLLARKQSPQIIRDSVTNFNWPRISRLLLNIYYDTIKSTYDTSTKH